jgi:hypothetical protein
MQKYRFWLKIKNHFQPKLQKKIGFGWKWGKAVEI